jgi:predicted TIM-barrel fold metal-dependent hydrolase
MDLKGIYASVCFPSTLSGFSGQRFNLARDQDLGLAVLRAWNDWHLEEWAGAHPGRIVPCQLPWLTDPQLAAQEVESNAERGFTAITFPDLPEKLGLPSINTRYWDPFLAACQATGTVICLHIGSSSWTEKGSTDSPIEVEGALFPFGSMVATVDWLYSKVPVRFPELKLSIAEGGVGWVPPLVDRLDHMARSSDFRRSWADVEESPIEVLLRNFYFCSIDDVVGFENIDRIGVEHVMVESDYPHIDGTWPDTQFFLARQLVPLDDDAVEKVTWGNASNLFRHPVPPEAFEARVPYVRDDATFGLTA